MQFWRRANDGYPSATYGTRSGLSETPEWKRFDSNWRLPEGCRLKREIGTLLMAIHKQILEWQAAHPNITWIGWGIVWAIVLVILFWPRALG
jgi:hypothetical protein